MSVSLLIGCFFNSYIRSWLTYALHARLALLQEMSLDVGWDESSAGRNFNEETWVMHEGPIPYDARGFLQTIVHKP